MSTQLRFIGLPSGLSDGGVPRLQVATPAGLIREIPLTKRDLLGIIKSAASALEVMER